MVEAFVPAAVKEDPRYYTLGHGNVFKRAGYAFSRLAITRTDSGGTSPNISEVVGAGAVAGIANAYYPSNENHLVKTYQRWLSQMIQDGATNIAKEFWPDIDHYVFRNKFELFATARRLNQPLLILPAAWNITTFDLASEPA